MLLAVACPTPAWKTAISKLQVIGCKSESSFFWMQSYKKNKHQIKTKGHKTTFISTSRLSVILLTLYCAVFYPSVTVNVKKEKKSTKQKFPLHACTNWNFSSYSEWFVSVVELWKVSAEQGQSQVWLHFSYSYKL